jgi:hypothetical protein
MAVVHGQTGGGLLLEAIVGGVVVLERRLWRPLLSATLTTPRALESRTGWSRRATIALEVGRLVQVAQIEDKRGAKEGENKTQQPEDGGEHGVPVRRKEVPSEADKAMGKATESEAKEEGRKDAEQGALKQVKEGCAESCH